MLQCCSNCRGLYSKTPLIFYFICLYHRCLPQVTKVQMSQQAARFPCGHEEDKRHSLTFFKASPLGVPI